MGDVEALEPSTVSSAAETCLQSLAGLAVSADLRSETDAFLVVGAVTTVEVYVSRIIRDAIDLSGLAVGGFSGFLLQELEGDFDRSWDARFRWLGRGFGVSVGGTPEGQDFAAVVELRNAFVHGGGRLTDQQTDNFTRFLALRKDLTARLGVVISGRLIRTTPRTSPNAVSACRQFVMALDKLATKVVPGVGGGLHRS